MTFDEVAATVAAAPAAAAAVVDAPAAVVAAAAAAAAAAYHQQVATGRELSMCNGSLRFECSQVQGQWPKDTEQLTS